MALLSVVFISHAQSKVTFEDQTVNGAAVVYNGSLSVVANPVKTGINASSYCLDVVNNGYAPVKFTNFKFPAGTSASYPYVKLRFKIAYKAYNFGTDLDYPQVDVFSSLDSPALNATDKLGTINSAWGSHVSDSLVWKNAEFTMSASLLSSIPNGILVLKLAKSKCEYLLDDIELIPSAVNNPDVITLQDFEANTVGDTYLSNGGTASVFANPVTTSGNLNSLKVVTTGYDQLPKVNVTLPAGKTLADYDRLYFDIYLVTSSVYTQVKIGADAASNLYLDSGYPSQGASGAWQSRDYAFSSTSTANSFVLNLGLGSNAVTYYIDNVKLHLKTIATGVVSKSVKSFNAFVRANQLLLTEEAQEISIFNTKGQLVLTTGNCLSVDLTSVASGVYIVKSVSNGNINVTKIAK